jgi:hypothetical protein
MSYSNENSGFIGKNNRKESDKHPDISGSINIEGKEFWLSGWKNAKGYGLKAKPKDAKDVKAKPLQGQQSEDDEIPFD